MATNRIEKNTVQPSVSNHKSAQSIISISQSRAKMEQTLTFTDNTVIPASSRKVKKFYKERRVQAFWVYLFATKNAALFGTVVLITTSSMSITSKKSKQINKRDIQ